MPKPMRQHSRHAMRALCIVRSSSDGRLLGDETLDVSYSGLRVKALDNATVGERVEISIELPNTRVWLDGGGRVVRVLSNRRASDDDEALGIQVDRLDGMHRLLLAQVARSHPALESAPSRTPDYAGAVREIAQSVI